MLKHLLLLTTLFFALSASADEGKNPSLKNFLNPDGTISSNASGSFDATGFRMNYGKGGKPVFSPAGPGDNYWEDGFGYSGINGIIYAIAVSGSDTYVGGSFTDAGGVAAADYVAKWDGSQWSALGQGTDMYVRAIAVIGSDVYVGGQFNNAKNADGSNVPGTGNIARWNGTEWNAMGYGMENDVLALAVSGSLLYVGGNFGAALSAPGTYVPSTNTGAIWDGTSWSSMHNININGEINVITVAGTKIYVGGAFNNAGGVAAADWLACWTGSAWTALGTSVNSSVYAIAVSGSTVYVGGNFTAAGGVANTRRIARWNGSAWSAMGGGISDVNYPSVNAIAIIGTDVFVGGTFQYVKSNATTDVYYTSGIARWNGSSWSAMQRGVYGSVYCLAVNTNLIAAGTFHATDAIGNYASNTHNLAKWTGSWQSAGMYSPNKHGLNSDVTAIHVSGSDVYVGGYFRDAGGLPNADYVARWDGSQWHALGTGTNGTVKAIVSFGGNVYVAGEFTVAGGISAIGIARWNGTNWSSLGSGTSGILALAHKDGILYAGGYFNSAGGVAANYVAKWNGTAWSALGTGTSGQVNALAVSGNDIIAGGQFTSAGGIAVQNIARWNGTAWAPIGTANSGVNGVVRAIAVSGNDIHVGGDFNTVFNNNAGFSSYYYSKFDGTNWIRFSEPPGQIYSIALIDDKVYLGSNSSNNKGLIMYNGTDVLLPGTGVNNYVLVSALASSGTKLYAGGSFLGTNDGSKAMSKFGIFNELRPSVKTTEAANISFNSADLGGEVTIDGGLPISEKGIVWSASNTKPDTTNMRISFGSGGGVFNQNYSPLPANNPVYVRAYARNEAGFVYGNAITFNTGSVDVTVITSFSPQTGVVGSTVIITGQNFNTTPSGNIVYFGASRAEVVNASATSLEVIVPACASFQSISVLNKDLPAAAWSLKPFLVTFTSPGIITPASFATSVDFEVPATAYAMQAADIDNDGKTDIVIQTNSQILVYRNTSTTGVIDANSLAAPVVVASGNFLNLGLVISDLDGDGLFDFAAGTTNYRIQVTRNASTPGNIAWDAPVEVQANSNIQSLLAADLNNDGKPELLYRYNYTYCYYSCSYYGYLMVHTNMSVPGVINKESFSPYRQAGFVHNVTNLSAGDLDNDGKIDLVGRVNNMVYLFRNLTVPGQGTTYSFDQVGFATGTNSGDIAIADLDGDNKLDLVMQPLVVYRNNYAGGYLSGASFSLIGNYGTQGKIGLNDIDGDGKADIVLAQNSLSVHKNIADAATFDNTSIQDAVTVDPTGNLYNTLVTDIDADSRPELVVTQASGGILLKIYRNITLNALPLTLVNFNGRLQGKDGLLYWTTSSEINTLDFEIERSANGIAFVNAGRINASGNSSTTRNYTFTDPNIAAHGANVVYYRLKMNDVDGNFSYSGIIAIRLDHSPATFTVYPNPVENAAMVSINAEKTGIATLSLTDQAGKVVLRRNAGVQQGTNNIVLDMSRLSAGIYDLRVSINGSLEHKKIIKK